MYEIDYRTIAFLGTMAAFQQTSIATLEAEREDIEANIRPCFEDDAYHAERNADATQVKTIGKCPLLTYYTKRRRQFGHITKVASNALNTFLCEQQAVVKRVAWLKLLQVERICRKQLSCLFLSTICNLSEHIIALLVRQKHEHSACFLGLMEQLLHDGRNSVWIV